MIDGETDTHTRARPFHPPVSSPISVVGESTLEFDPIRPKIKAFGAIWGAEQAPPPS